MFAVRKDAPVSLAGCALVMELAYLSVHLAGSQTTRIVSVLAAYAVTGLAFAWMLWRVHRGDWSCPSRATWVIVIVGAVAFRVTLLPLNPETSPDVNRYLWEGLVQANGFNPYVHAPGAPALASIAQAHRALHAHVTFREVPAVYGPFAQLLFRINAEVFGATLLGWKVLLLPFDCLLAVSVFSILRRRSLPRFGVVAVLWCPLLIVETYEGAHLDVIGVALLACAIATMRCGRWVLSAIALGLSIQIKYLWPSLALIVLFFHAPRRRRAGFVALVGLVSVVCWLPYIEGLPAAAATAKLFAVHFSFNDPVYALLRSLPGPSWEAAVLVTLLLGGLAVLLVRRRPRAPWSDTWLLVGTALLLGPVAYPWYFQWVVPGLAVRPAGWLVAWVLTVPVLHVVGLRYVMTGHWDPMPWLCGVLAVIPVLGLLHTWRRRMSRADTDEAAPRRRLATAFVAGRFER